MKPLLDRKVQRLDVEPAGVKEWESAEHHLTHDGQHAFHKRMLDRIKAAQQPAPANVKRIKPREAK